MKKPWVKTLLKVLGTAIIIGLLVSRIDWDLEEFERVFRQLDILWLVLSLSGVILVLGLKSFRWNLLLRLEDCNYPKWSSFIAYMSSYTIGLVTPGRVGEIARLYYVREETGITFYRSFKTLIADRIFDFAILIWFGVTGMMYFYKALGDISGLIYLLLAALMMLTAWGIGYLLLKKFINPDTSPSGLRFIREIWNGMFGLPMFYPWLLTIVAYLIFYYANMMIFKSIGISLTLVDIGFILSLMSLATIVPISLAGFGTREASLVYLLSFYAINPETAIVFSLLQFSAFFLWGGLIGLFFWLYKPVKMKMIREDYQAFRNFLKLRKNSAEK